MINSSAQVASYGPNLCRSCAATWTSFFAFVHRTLPPVFLTSCGWLPGAALRLSNSAARAASNWARTAFLASAGKGDGTFGFVSPRARCNQHRSARKAGAVSYPSDTDKGFARSCLNRATQAAPVTAASCAPVATSRAVALAFGAPRSLPISTTASPPATVPSPSPPGSKTWTFRAVGAQFTHAAAVSRNASTESDSPVWNSNFGCHTPSTRRHPRNCICSMACRFHAIDARLPPFLRLLDGVHVDEVPNSLVDFHTAAGSR